MLPDSPRQLTDEPCVPGASSETTLSRSASSYSQIAHKTSTDHKQETTPKQAPPPPDAQGSPFELTAKHVVCEHVPNPSADPKQATLAAPLCSPFETAAMEMACVDAASSSDVQHETTPKQACEPGSAQSPVKKAAKELAHAPIPKSSSDAVDEPAFKHSIVAGSLSPFETAAKQLASEDTPNLSSHTKQENIPQPSFPAGSTCGPLGATPRQMVPEGIAPLMSL